MQSFGLELLVLLDGWAENDAKTEQRNEQLRIALVAAGVPVEDVFDRPEPEPENYDDFDPAEDDDRDLDYSAVDWAESASPDDWSLLQEQLDSTRVMVQGESDEEGPDGPGLPDVDFDREWQ
ncbi:hypothetical protein ACH4S8_37635 [Streptomyces sp. NPDC021080]|uniref:hypothetical protein n=1 Tax=Streptomyces sp. NPDC021080 TaxID=3365110 RepID=UPI00378AACD2